ncbi:MAG: hypothetical protein ACLSTO_03615 [Bilophila wadsworthia]
MIKDWIDASTGFSGVFEALRISAIRVLPVLGLMPERVVFLPSGPIAGVPLGP